MHGILYPAESMPESNRPFQVDGLARRAGVDPQGTEAAKKLIDDACAQFEVLTDHKYLGERRQKWIVTEEGVRRSEAHRRQMAQMIVKQSGG